MGHQAFWRRVENSIKIPNCQYSHFQGHCQRQTIYNTWLFNICLHNAFQAVSHLAGGYQHNVERLDCSELCECIWRTCFESNYPWLGPGLKLDFGQFKTKKMLKVGLQLLDNDQLTSILTLNIISKHRPPHHHKLWVGCRIASEAKVGRGLIGGWAKAGCVRGCSHIMSPKHGGFPRTHTQDIH